MGSDLTWFKSSYSDSSEADDCVEVALNWATSSYSDSNDPTDCVEVAATPTTIHIRDTKNRPGPCLTFGPRAWAGFLPYATSVG